MAWPVRRDVEQRPLTVYSRAHSRGILRKEQIQGGYVAAANRLGCLVLHLADYSSSLTRKETRKIDRQALACNSGETFLLYTFN